MRRAFGLWTSLRRIYLIALPRGIRLHLEYRVTALRITRLALDALWLSVILPRTSGSPAEAHLVTTGLGPAYDGILHFLTFPEDLVPVSMLALLAGQCGRQTARRILFVLPLAWLVGGLAGMVARFTPPLNVTWRYSFCSAAW